jgi:glycosyltransferase involved in cell wall biosynthesis
MHFIGGAERLMMDLAAGLADSETEVQLVTGLCHETWKSRLGEQASLSLREVGQAAPGSLSFWFNVTGFAHRLSMLINPETDVMVTSSFPSSLVGKMFTRRHHAKVVHYLHEAPMVLHDTEGVRSLEFQKRMFYHAMSSLYAKDDIEAVAGSDTILANSELTREINSKVYGIDEPRIGVVYPGVNAARTISSTSAPKLVAQYVKERIPIVFIPRGTQSWRNPEICLGALAKLSSPFRGVFTGGTEHDGNRLLKLAKRLGIAESILWVQELSDADLDGLYSHSSVVISIPKRQPFGLIPLEALIHGAPPIISSSSGVSEVLRDQVDAIHINERDCEELANAVETLILDDNVRAKLVSNGRKTVLEKLTSARFVEEMREKIFD